jgi:type II secretory pathway component PulL
MVNRSASKSWQMSRVTSSMISSMLVVEWMRLVTAWSFLENASFDDMSATFAGPLVLGSNTALI